MEMKASCEYGEFYVIGKGETLHGIARRFGISHEVLLGMNPYLNPSYYLPGQMIIVPRRSSCNPVKNEA